MNSYHHHCIPLDPTHYPLLTRFRWSRCLFLPLTCPLAQTHLCSTRRQSWCAIASLKKRGDAYSGMVLHPIIPPRRQPRISLHKRPEMRLDESLEHTDRNRVFGPGPLLNLSRQPKAKSETSG